MAPTENGAATPAVGDISLPGLQAQYRAGLTPTTLVTSLYPAWASAGPIFIHLPPLDQLLQRAAALEAIPVEQRGPLWGVPCAVKDNVDVAGMPTTAACPAFSYMPTTSGPAVQALVDAGCLIVGKTNMDQFAAGLVGTRTPYGACSTPFDARFISGGSSSGSGAAVGGGLVSFALGTDTAGSGRVPAGFCGCVGIKGTVGAISTVGVVPACAALDCLTVFARSVEDGAMVARLMRAAHAGAQDVWRRRPPSVVPSPPAVGFRFAVPRLGPADWSSPGGPQAAHAAAALFEEAVDRLKAIGGVQVDVDLTPFTTVAAMLYGTAFVAERYSGLRAFLEAPDQIRSDHKQAAGNSGGGGGTAGPKALADVVADERMVPVTRHILAGAARFSAVDVYDHNAQLAVHRAAAQAVLAQVDVLLVPTALAHYTIQEIEGEEGAATPKWSQNANLGRFTNFVNLLDMCGVAVPAGVLELDAQIALKQAEAEAEAGGLSSEQVTRVKARTQHLQDTGSTQVTLPFGVTLLAPAWQDEWLWGVGAAMHRASGLGCGPEGHKALNCSSTTTTTTTTISSSTTTTTTTTRRDVFASAADMHTAGLASAGNHLD